jgi:uncharacterized protein YegL
MKPAPPSIATELAFILDRSGSMETVRQAAIDGFNEFLRDQQAAPGNTRLTLVLFDHEILTVHDSVPVAEILPLDSDSFVPRGSTSLLDAIGDTIDRLGRRFDQLPAAQKPGHVAIAILTDGEENSSSRYTWHDVSGRIQHQTNKYSWDFLFLGAGPDAIATAAKMSIPTHHSATYMADSVGQTSASKGASRKISAARNSKAGLTDPTNAADHATPLDQIVQEEDQQRRGQ